MFKRRLLCWSPPLRLSSKLFGWVEAQKTKIGTCPPVDACFSTYSWPLWNGWHDQIALLHLHFCIWLASRKLYNSNNLSKYLRYWMCFDSKSSVDYFGSSFDGLSFRFFVRIGRELWPVRLRNNVTGWRNLFLCLSCAIFQDPLPETDV